MMVHKWTPDTSIEKQRCRESDCDLDQVWSDILNIINNTPEFSAFRDPQLFFSAKGTKLHFKSNQGSPTILDVMENFQSYLDFLIDLDYVHLDRFYLDLAKEICPENNLDPDNPDPDNPAHIYSWKRCCLENYLNWIYDGNPPKLGSPGQRFYNQNMLRDACNLTSVTPKSSKLRKVVSFILNSMVPSKKSPMFPIITLFTMMLWMNWPWTHNSSKVSIT